ncbi:glycoside hydrolase family 16 protein [uncultured Nocardioides sp.]|uniref:glycoside hydrolase family 16 protein n=1 Tax=uncultured Nocardioides sp. TaxID=198441 RepID=UPI00262A1DB3|nr:glycoside hydrolase family 16 protein [uncultured Nocardioides sp.]
MTRSLAALAVSLLLPALLLAGCGTVAGEGRSADGDFATGGRVTGPGPVESDSPPARDEPRREGLPEIGPDGRLKDPIPVPERPEPTERRWEEVFFDDFDTLDTSVWRVYDGVPGCCPDALWDSSMVRVEDSTLVLDTAEVDGDWLSGGVGSWDSPTQQLYGRWDMRVRTDDDALGVTVAALLWPSYGGWPPEIDFYEIFETSPGRRQMTVTNHYGELAADGTHPATRRPVRGDFARWHEVSVRWTADEIQVVVDGQAVETVREPERISDVPMWLAMQTAAKRVDGEDPSFEGGRAMRIDWVRVYAPA